MSMSRRDYEDAATAINLSADEWIYDQSLSVRDRHEGLVCLWKLTMALADRFAMRNDRFDRDRFKDAAMRSVDQYTEDVLGFERPYRVRVWGGRIPTGWREGWATSEAGILAGESGSWGDEVDRGDPDLIASLNSAISEGAL